ncbi:DNA-directed RNA polymerase subunit delta [Staphylococcus saccharolyticus]|uniref:Probable DNA-directed RNA polymerase subunit delta n=1 Tax=Staphylococcus saccharolyticus TaxID=33028 RepID=A0A380H0I0_9STAP|nr:DNA-directed RNA polymerase subunit delta [Staphylococcus saccharolyticus]MBL7566024.1 DNA-directed RNA polymerase subunit delta [Staphylococcus saccharolyticus]MBL7572463.1 DNA-directed RNA polymerase subunit delta [Staphylococcus saccharolyticus]QQB98628.1 DNA-directed RNA polymerase subunit delta [Staphylococcus saccharolyticus]RTX95111.1 DNA-directed RNA polymerase subunit delta [Staphylococcus saccharolyticus]TAA96208.1 DNA-directed RNA polymerase subunit delta [Staphylococcus saccharo
MKIQDYTKEMVDEKSFIDMAYTLLNDKQTTMNLYDIIDEFKSLGGYEYEDIENRIVQFYTDLNTDGRFLNVGENQWGLRDWYSVDDIEEKIAPTIQKFDILDDDDEEDQNLKLLGEDEADDDNISAQTDDQETLDDSENEDVDEEMNDTDIVIEEEEEDDIAEEEEEAFEEEEDFND